jgi:L-ascorbate metabolism protein UlaG (beta-lactamase superfamily)
MKIKYIAHSCFLFTSSNGLRVMMDPYKAGGYDGAIGYAPIRDEADIVVVTHDHPDHSAVEDVLGYPLTVRVPANARGVRFEMVEAPHDSDSGKRRGMVRIFLFEMDSIRVCHLSDLGDLLDDSRLKQIGKVDVLLVPVGGTYTLDGEKATQVIRDIRPALAIPMHFKTPRIGFPLDPLDSFLKHCAEARRPMRSEIEISAGSLPKSTSVVVLEPSN